MKPPLPSGKGNSLMTKKNAVQKRPSSAVGEFDEDALAQMLEDEGAGMEDMTADDYALPFIKLLQALSPEVDKSDDLYIQGAEPGRAFNSVSRELYPKDGFLVVPVMFKKVFIEWRKRNEGGGFINQYESEQEGRQEMDPANELIETANVYVLAQTEEGIWTPAILSMTSTKLKVVRRWNAMAAMWKLPKPGGVGTFTPPYFARTYLLSTVQEENMEGKYYNFMVSPQKPTIEEGGAELYAEAKTFLASIRSGDVGADFTKDGGDVDVEIVAEDLPF